MIEFSPRDINYVVVFLTGFGAGAVWGWVIVALMRASRKCSPEAPSS